MARSSKQKLKLLYLMRMLSEKTDDDHTLTINDMIKGLSLYDIHAERKSIYDDLENLKEFGLDIVSRKSHTTEYFIASRDFELPELKLLVDAVQCSKFITHKKSSRLIKKLGMLASHPQAQRLQRQVYVASRVKTFNESIYYNVDCLHAAIASNNKVAFKYFDYDLDKKQIYRRNGDKYIVSPYGLSWDGENYYLIAFSSKYSDFIHYRVDRMVEIEIEDDARDPLPDNKELDIAEYTTKLFSMFGGSEVRVHLRFDNSLINSVIDRFGQDVLIEKSGEGYFDIRINAVVSTTFFSWIMQFGSMVKILSPEEVFESYKDMLDDIRGIY